MAKLKISNKEITNFIKPVPLCGIKRKPLSALFLEIYISAFVQEFPPHFVQKRRHTRRVFPLLFEESLERRAKTREILRESLFQPPLEREEECVQGAYGIEWIGFFDFHPPPRISLLGQTICYGGWSIEGLVIRLVAPVEDWG